MSQSGPLTGRARTRAIDRLRGVNGIGEATAVRLVDDHGIETLTELLEAESDGRLGELPGVTPDHCRKVRESVREIMSRPEFARPEPRRVPKAQKRTPTKAGVGCGSLLLLPVFLTTLQWSLTAASGPLFGGGFASFVRSGLMLLVLVPLTMFVGGFSLQMFRRLTGHEKANEFPRKASAGLGISLVTLFGFSTVFSILIQLFGAASGAVATGGVGLVVALVALVAIGGGLVAAGLKRKKKTAKRKRHARPPRPPWEHPLARTKPANMLTEALVDQYNVIALGAAVALSIVLWNPLPALIAGGLELPWLALAPDTKWFRDRIEAKHAEMAEEQARERRAEELEYLSDEQRENHRQMMRVARSAREAMHAARFPFDTSKIDRLVNHHLWLMQLENYYADQRDPSRIEELDDKLSEVRAEQASTQGRMAEVLARRARVLEQRRQQLTRMDGRLRDVTGERRSLEEAIRLVAESALSAPGRQVAGEIDDVLMSLQATEEVVLDFQAEEDELSRQIEEAAEVAA